MEKKGLIQETFRTISGYRFNSDIKIILIDLQTTKTLETSNLSLVDNVNWDYAFVYMSVYVTSVWVPGKLYILDSKCNLVDNLEVNGWKLILEGHSTGSYIRGFPTHRFITCDPVKDFLETKYLLHGDESYIKQLIFNVFIPLTKFKNLTENTIDKKLDYIIELLERMNVGSEDNTKSIQEG